MATTHSKSPVYESTRKFFKALSDKYDLEYKCSSITLVGKDAGVWKLWQSAMLEVEYIE
ncbi:MAG TPA: hypothetical protein VI643_07465 [Planctomycetota bacterium]|nr:hypothetical protein [Planctomycetota bacterium]